MKGPDQPELYSIFAVRLGAQWRDSLIIRRRDLQDLRRTEAMGSQSSDAWKFDLAFRGGEVRCSGINLQSYRNGWEVLPVFGPAAGASD